VASTLGGSTSGSELPLLVLAMTGSASAAQIGLVFSAGGAGGLAGALQRPRLTRPRLTRRQLASA